MTDPPQPHRLNNSPCNTEQYTHIQVDQVNAVIIFYSLISQLIAYFGRVQECKSCPVFQNDSVHID